MTCNRYLDEQEIGPRQRLKPGRKPMVSESSPSAARDIAEINDLSKNTATSPQCGIEALSYADEGNRTGKEQITLLRQFGSVPALTREQFEKY